MRRWLLCHVFLFSASVCPVVARGLLRVVGIRAYFLTAYGEVRFLFPRRTRGSGLVGSDCAVLPGLVSPMRNIQRMHNFKFYPLIPTQAQGIQHHQIFETGRACGIPQPPPGTHPASPLSRRTFVCPLNFYATQAGARILPRTRLARHHASPAHRETARCSGPALFF